MLRTQIEDFEIVEGNVFLAGHRYDDQSPVVVNEHLDTQRAVLYQLDTRFDRYRFRNIGPGEPEEFSSWMRCGQA